MYSNVVKGGRCFNGTHRDRGQVVHIVIGEEPNGYWGNKSLCGSEPGRRGYGWSLTGKEPNCEKCLKKKEKLTKDPGLLNK